MVCHVSRYDTMLLPGRSHITPNVGHMKAALSTTSRQPTNRFARVTHIVIRYHMLASHIRESHWKWLIQHIARASLGPPTLSTGPSPHTIVATTPHHRPVICQTTFDQGPATRHQSQWPLAVAQKFLQADTLPGHFTCRTSPAGKYSPETGKKGRGRARIRFHSRRSSVTRA